MKRLLLATSLVLACLAAPAAFAGDHHRHHDRHHYDDDDDRDDDDRGYYRQSYKHRGWERRDYRRGERIEVVYVEPRYYVDDYEYYHLRRPPSGHRWIRTDDGRYILVAVATGIIADILLHH
ncbi:RcnB family protein [Lysobacter solisilvae (ex Woo and Kim 2020)]|uniref:RcnB family protein n=1 Tax=Agrilutibacter terrestris TaxID=2865112 RepID=A0A7H0G060_9GAMM|nr:RcnB family protein [Lysobacter terrestris]QNP41676.1 RcnB family protein [Lysobacter terrestris]